jgi:hypothetical protein
MIVVIDIVTAMYIVHDLVDGLVQRVPSVATPAVTRRQAIRRCSIVAG